MEQNHGEVITFLLSWNMKGKCPPNKTRNWAILDRKQNYNKNAHGEDTLYPQIIKRLPPETRVFARYV